MVFLFDSRWVGEHGIGRFARMVNKHLQIPSLELQGKPSSPFDAFLLFIALLRLPSNVGVFSPGYNAPLFTFRPFIFTIHDLNHIDRPENSNPFKRLYFRLIIRRACRNALRIFTVSEFSRQRIIDWSNVSPDHVVNVGNGVDECYRPDVLSYSPGYSYLLCVSNRKTHKNEPRVVAAFAQAKIDPSIRLIFTGLPNVTLSNLCIQHGIEHRVIFLGRVPEEELPSLYRGALGLVFPSLYEGFGLPVIEAMACGVPVLTSNTSSLPEIAGDAALLVDPLSVSQISVGIQKICTDTDLRKMLVEKGFRRAAKFSWDSVANKIQDVLKGQF